MTTPTSDATPVRYDPGQFESAWQARWEADGSHHASDDDPRERFYFLTMFPYPSGDLHIGHWYNYALADAAVRYRRMLGQNVMFPMGFDAFGLPAENAAIKDGIHPSIRTAQNIERMRTQLRAIGSSFDWERELNSSDPAYYRWTQWFFLQLYNNGLAYRKRAAANWCPGCVTVLANEQVLRDDDGMGRCERSGDVVETRDLEQWFFRITDYADELLDFSQIDWPDRIRTMQTNWIGRSEGAEIRFDLEQAVQDASGENWDHITVFTTRPDTVYGVSYMVIAPEHPLVAALTTADQRRDVDDYIQRSRQATEIERQSTEREKSGVFTGAYATHPLTNERVPVWTADYVLLSYGTGAVMGVPAHDTRDFSFAQTYGLPGLVVICPPDTDPATLDGQHTTGMSVAYVDPGSMVNSAQFSGTASETGKVAVAEALEQNAHGGGAVSYRLRDWLISRQRYWGAPIPIVYCAECGIVPVPEDQLPVLLPEDAEFVPTGESPLKRHDSFRQTSCPQCDGPAERETDTMDTFMCSSWYMFRFADPHNSEAPFSPELAKTWLPVDQYVGGAEHAVMHLLYARFFTKALRDMGHLQIDEPFTRLFNQGTIVKDGAKMSKSRGNVVNPDDWVSRLGADAVRLYLMFLGPWDRGGDWDDSGIQGHSRWLNRVWNLALDDVPAIEDSASEGRIRRLTHQMVKKTTADIEAFRFNTMLAAMMEFTNALAEERREHSSIDANAWREALECLVLCLAPLAPHITEELWQHLGKPYSVHRQNWPSWDDALARSETITLVVQVNGKVRDTIEVAPGLSQDEAQSLAHESEKVSAHVAGKTLRKTIFVPDKLLNLVVG
jgi:leucyl-tRNA synthetase